MKAGQTKISSEGSRLCVLDRDSVLEDILDVGSRSIRVRIAFCLRRLDFYLSLRSLFTYEGSVITKHLDKNSLLRNDQCN